MTTLISKLRVQGASTVTTIPTEITRRLGLDGGDTISWVEDGFGGFRVGKFSADTEAAIEQHEAIMDKFDSVFRALAK
jgi:bifunctional DNA-binding transcriptional regulator/antitoxin component of YhaV-PrlF toxin-antitoxin module